MIIPAIISAGLCIPNNAQAQQSTLDKNSFKVYTDSLVYVSPRLNPQTVDFSWRPLPSFEIQLPKSRTAESADQRGDKYRHLLSRRVNSIYTNMAVCSGSFPSDF